MPVLTLVLDAFNAYKTATGGTEDKTTGLLSITEEQFNNLQDLNFNVGGVTYTLNANAQIWPRSMNSLLGGEEGKIYLVASDVSVFLF